MSDDADWFDGFFDIEWVGAAPHTCIETDDELLCERYDFNVSDGGLLALRDKAAKKIHIYAQHTWHHIEVTSYNGETPFVNR